MSPTAEIPISTKERWRTAGRFADVLEAEVKSRRQPMVSRMVSWFNLCRICQDLEEQMRVVSDTSPVGNLRRIAIASARRRDTLRP